VTRPSSAPPPQACLRCPAHPLTRRVTFSRGWEVAAVREFKNALGLEDQDAAAVHLEVGRRIFRQRMEQGDKSAETEARKEFQKLVFLSQLVFGAAKAGFLLPWKVRAKRVSALGRRRFPARAHAQPLQRVFAVTDSQVAVAIRDSATKLYKDQLQALLPAMEPDRQALEALELRRLELAFDAEPAGEVLAGAARVRVEACAQRAHEGLKARTRARDVSSAMSELEGVVEYNRALKALAAEAAAGAPLPPGLAPVSLFGGAYEQDAKMGELRDLFRMYVAERIKDGQFSDDALTRAGELRLAFGMGVKEADAIVAEVSTKVYRLVLKRALGDGSLAAAPSPARALQGICDALRFPPPAAEAVNLEFYRARLEEALAAGALSEENDAAVASFCKLLCVPKATDRAARKELCGDVWKKTLVLALGAGADGFSSDLRDKVASSRAAVRLGDDVAIEILGDMAKKVWLNSVRESRNKPSRLDAAKELKNMVLFNSAVITPLVSSIRGSKLQEAAREIGEILKEAQAMAAAEDAAKAAAAAAAVPASDAVIDVAAVDADAAAQKASDAEEVSSLNKVAAAASAEEKLQKEITLRDDLPLVQRQELYRTFLLFCMTGDQVYAPMGSTITIERDQSEFARLSQLGDLLGLNPFEVSEVHRGLAEQAFKANAQQLLGADAILTRDKTEQLKQLQTQLGLPDEAANKVITAITSGKQTANLQALVATGKLTLEDVEAMAASGVDVSNALSADMRLALLRKEVEKALTSGMGVWDAARWESAAPVALGLEAGKVSVEIRKIATDKRRTQLVQAVALLRQKDTGAVLKSLANLRASSEALPGCAPLDWPVKDELMDLYSVACAAHAPREELDALAASLALDQATTESLRAVVASGQFVLEKEDASNALY